MWCHRKELLGSGRGLGPVVGPGGWCCGWEQNWRAGAPRARPRFLALSEDKAHFDLEEAEAAAGAHVVAAAEREKLAGVGAVLDRPRGPGISLRAATQETDLCSNSGVRIFLFML